MSMGYRLFALRDQKAREFFEIRRDMFGALSAGLKALDPKRPRVLFHVASVGELLMAIPVMRAVKDEPGAPVVALSYTSASVSNHMPREVPADVVTPSPIDSSRRVFRFLDLMDPSLIVFSTYDLWPNFVWEASGRVIPMVLINASLPQGSGRLRPAARWFYRGLYSRLKAVGAITENDARRHARLGAPPERVAVTGNCRFDQTLDRCKAVADDDADLAALPGWDLCLVAGSTWPEDHERLLPALDGLLDKHPGLGAVIAPHEPGEDHVSEIEDFMAGRGKAVARYQALRDGQDSAGARVVVVDVVGVLYKLYRKGQAAYIGGSFKQGVHNVMEPAGMGLPVVVGPVHENSAEALEMRSAGGLFAASDRASLEAALDSLIGDAEARGLAGEAALGVVLKNAGATGRTMEMVKEFLPGGQAK